MKRCMSGDIPSSQVTTWFIRFNPCVFTLSPAWLVDTLVSVAMLVDTAVAAPLFRFLSYVLLALLSMVSIGLIKSSTSL